MILGLVENNFTDFRTVAKTPFNLVATIFIIFHILWIKE